MTPIKLWEVEVQAAGSRFPETRKVVKAATVLGAIQKIQQLRKGQDYNSIENIVKVELIATEDTE